jgi:DNA-binding NtrC family response regulator
LTPATRSIRYLPSIGIDAVSLLAFPLRRCGDQHPEEGSVVDDLGRSSAPCGPDVLVVDDDPDVLRFLDLALRQHGFAVRQARGGEQAVEVYRRQHQTIDVVLLDVQMPPPDGPQTFALLRAIDPGVQCVFMSGHTGVYTAEDLFALGAAYVLQKPFASVAGLAGLLRRLALRTRTGSGS